MCFFLTIAVPSQHIDRIRDVLGPGLKTHPTSNPNVIAALPSGYLARLATTGMCSCDLYARTTSEPMKDRSGHLRKKYEKLGWSQAKISRALKQAESSDARAKKPLSGFRQDIIDGVTAICRSVGSIAMMVHWYQGDVETEQLTLRAVASGNFDDLPARLQHLQEDEVLVAKG